MTRNANRISNPHPCPGLNLHKVCRLCCSDNRDTLYRCRVCENAFHLRCLKSHGQLQSEKDERQFSDWIESKIGWSCSDCENLSNYLTEEEMQSIIDRFDQLDSNKDGTVGQEEFLLYQAAKYFEKTGEKMKKDSLEMELCRFKAIDKDATNSIDWWEFLQFEAINCLGNRSKAELVALLYPSEIKSIEKIFHSYDKNRTGFISHSDIGAVFLEWYMQFNVSSENLSYMHVGAMEKYKDLIGADDDESGFIDWNEFLKHQAIYMISARPNNTNLHVLNRTRQESLHQQFIEKPVSSAGSNISSHQKQSSNTTNKQSSNTTNQTKTAAGSRSKSSAINSGIFSKATFGDKKSGSMLSPALSRGNVNSDVRPAMNKSSTSSMLRNKGSNVAMGASISVPSGKTKPVGVQNKNSADKVRR